MEAMRALLLMMVFKSPVARVIFIPFGLAIMFIERCREHFFFVAATAGELIQVEAERSPSAFKIPGAHELGAY
jgi:hypothetical protein